jgi:hypothetical protein
LETICRFGTLYVKVEKANENVAFNCKERANKNEKCRVLYLIKNTSQLTILDLVSYYNPNFCTPINYGPTNTKPTNFFINFSPLGDIRGKFVFNLAFCNNKA